MEEIWAIIPARGGSKSIPLKNLVLLDGHSLIEYVIYAAKKSKRITRIICSTDHERIANVCEKHDVEIHRRPSELSGDDIPVLRVFKHLLRDIKKREKKLPDIICILQPTSPFVMPAYIDDAVEKLENDIIADSVQTVTHFPHNYHAYNQRVIENGIVRFRFSRERQICYNKQTKPIHYIFGNLIVTRSRTLLEKDDIFGSHSLPSIINIYYSVDIDGPEDLIWAEWILKTKKVVLPHMNLPIDKRSKRMIHDE